jgi:hypothetical protein
VQQLRYIMLGSSWHTNGRHIIRAPGALTSCAESDLHDDRRAGADYAGLAAGVKDERAHVGL